MRSVMKLVALAAAAMLVTAGCNVLRGQQDAGEYVDDATLTARVKAALLDDEQVKGTQFDVDVYQGRVTLSGVADTDEERQRAAEIAKQVPGVRSVDNAIRLAEAGPSEDAESPRQQ